MTGFGKKQPRMYVIREFADDRFSIIPRPRGGDWLADEAGLWKTSGINTVVSCLTEVENIELDLCAEETTCRNHGIDFIGFPIEDRSVPDSPEPTIELIHKLIAELKTGRRVVVHCRMGIGRSGMLAAGILCGCGYEADTAFNIISNARGLPVPDTQEQRQWIESHALRFCP